MSNTEADENYEDGICNIASKKRYEELGFQPEKELYWNKFLPYADKLDAESQYMLNSIKENLVKAVAMRDISIGAGMYLKKLLIYIRLYGMKFSKEDRIKFIELCLELMCIPELEPSKVNTFCIVILQLFRPPHTIGPDDFVVDWRSLHKLYNIYIDKVSTKGIFHLYLTKRKNKKKFGMSSLFSQIFQLSKMFGGFLAPNDFRIDEDDKAKKGLDNNLKKLIQTCSTYFPITAVKEILNEILPTLQPLETEKKTNQTFETLNLFLNFHRGYDLWLDDFINLWNTYHNPPWSVDLVNIIGNVSFENIGKIDWEPHLPIMFTRILRWIDLPVTYKQLKMARNQKFSAVSLSKWIVSTLGPTTSGQTYLNKLISTIQSFLHPANSGRWLKLIGQLLVNLQDFFIKRLEYERFRKPHWKDEVPDSYKLTEKCITDFVECLTPAAFQIMYSNMDSNEMNKMFKNLSNLRPELIIPGVIDRVYANLESLTEPHRLTASLQCLTAVSRSLVNCENGYTAGRTHILPILFAILPGIDTNDLRKSLLTVNIFGSFLHQIPIVDCSKAGLYYDDLTDEEQIICNQTADFEDFLIQFVKRLFALIKLSTQDNSRMEQSKNDTNKSKQDIIIESFFSSIVQVLLRQCSPEILLVVSKSVVNFIKSNLLEPHIAANMAGMLVNYVALLDDGYIFKMLVPYLYDCINAYISEHPDVAEMETIPDDFHYYLVILYNLCKGDRREIMKYLDTYILPILDGIMEYKSKMTAKISANILQKLLKNLSSMQADIRQFSNISTIPIKDCLPIRCWGKKMDPNETIDFYIPNEESRLFCEKILHRYLPSVLDRLKKHISDECPLSREDLVKYTNFVLPFLYIANYLHNWTEEPKIFVDTVVDYHPPLLTITLDDAEITMPDGKNVRLAIIETIGKLQDKILATSDDDTNTLKVIILIWENVHQSKSSWQLYDAEIKTFKQFKRSQEFELTKRKSTIKASAATRVMLQHACRDGFAIPMLTETHAFIIQKLLKLSTSHYGVIRCLAQMKMFRIISNYSFAYCEIIDNLVDYLRLDSNVHHETFKGALYILLGGSYPKLFVKPHWTCIEKLWLSVLQSTPSEKPSIVYLLDAISKIVSDEFVTLPIRLHVPDTAVDIAMNLIENTNQIVKPEDIEFGKKRLEKINQDNYDCYMRIINSIISTSQNNSLHWRYHLLGSLMIRALIHPHVKVPTNVIKYFLENLLHDSILERKLAMAIINCGLRQYKQDHLKIKVDPFEIAGVVQRDEKLRYGIRDDNRWLQYDLETLPKSQEEWDSPRYLYKPNGFFGWSSNFEAYAPYSKQPSVDRSRDDMNEFEQTVYDFFANKENVDKFITYWSMEENQVKEKFKKSRYIFIKNLFKMFGDVFFPLFHPHIERLIKEKSLESNHRCAAELLCGIMQGMKHWPFEKTKQMYEKLIPLIRLALDNITVETDDIWSNCFEYAAMRIDPRKQYWLYEVLMEDPLRKNTSFIDCSRICCLQGPFNQHVWQMNSFAHRLLDYLRPYLNHPFQNVRASLGNILINVFEADIEFKDSSQPESPRIKNMICEVLEKIEPLNQDMPSPRTCSKNDDCNELEPQSLEQKQYDEAVRLYKTIVIWIIGTISRNTNGNQKSYFDLLPFACRLESCEHDSELSELSVTFLVIISQALTMPDCMGYALEKINEISLSAAWCSRLAVIDVLQVLVFHNLAIVSSNPEWVKCIQDIVLRLLEDTSLEVREKAAQVLGGLLHCSFLPATDKLLEQFKKKCRTKIIRKPNKPLTTVNSSENLRNDGLIINETSEAEAIRLRHSGVLGLCAFISAYPYDIPDFVPEIFEHLPAHLNDPQPIPSTIHKTIGNFKRTHYDNWAVHELKFTENQLDGLNDLTIPLSYYS